jgi:hypothetical protein
MQDDAGVSIAIVAGCSAPVAALTLASGLRVFRMQRATRI